MKQTLILLLFAPSFLLTPAASADGSQVSTFELFCKQDKGPNINIALKLQGGEIRNINTRLPNSALKVTVTSSTPAQLLPVNVSFARSKGVPKNVAFTDLGLTEQSSHNFFGIKSCVINDLKKTAMPMAPHTTNEANAATGTQP